MTSSHNPDLARERKLLEDDLLPSLENRLGEYNILHLSQRHQKEFGEVVSGSRDFKKYTLPVVQTAEFGLIYPEYFITETETADEYGAAIEPHTKYIDVKDESLRDELRAFAEKWKAETTISEINLGRADVSKVSFSPNSRAAMYSERV